METGCQTTMENQTKIIVEQTGHTTRDTCPTAMRGDTISLDTVAPSQHPGAVLSRSHNTGSPPWQVYQMLKKRLMGHAGGLQNQEVVLEG